jgi:hypothetical protein
MKLKKSTNTTVRRHESALHSHGWLTSLSPPFHSRRDAIRIFAYKGRDGAAGFGLKRVSWKLEACKPWIECGGCNSTFCPDCMHGYAKARFDSLKAQFGCLPADSLRLFHLRVPGIVPGDQGFGECNTKLCAAVQSFTKMGSPFRRAVSSFSGSVLPVWHPKTSEHEAGLVVWVKLLCKTDDDVDEAAITKDWRTILVKEQVTDLGPWLWDVAFVRPVRNVNRVIDMASRSPTELPSNLVEIPAATIVDVFRFPRDIFTHRG